MTEEGGEKGAPADEAEPQNEPVDLDQLAPEVRDATHEATDAPAEASEGESPEADASAPEPDPKASSPQSRVDPARAQAMARKLAGGRRVPSMSGEGLKEPPNPALVGHPTTGGGAKAGATAPSKGKALESPPKTTPPGTAAGGAPPSLARRPLVDPSQRKQKAPRAPFYTKIPAKPLVALIVLAALGVGGWFGWKAIDRSRHADEYAVRDELFLYKFDKKDEHFATLDGMGTKAVQIAIGYLTDPTPVETSFGKSTTTTAEMAHMYLMHYAQRIGVDPPTKALDVAKLGGVRMKPADWSELKDLWTKWLADAQAKGKAH